MFDNFVFHTRRGKVVSEQSISTLEDQKIKEYQASQAFDRDQQLDYRYLDGQYVSVHIEVGKYPIRLARKFAQGICISSERDYIS